VTDSSQIEIYLNRCEGVKQ